MNGSEELKTIGLSTFREVWSKKSMELKPFGTTFALCFTSSKLYAEVFKSYCVSAFYNSSHNPVCRVSLSMDKYPF